MRAVILSIGDELTLGQTLDTNTPWLAARLAEHGVLCRWHLTLPDDRRAIAEGLRRAAEQAELVIATGGLGPTDDDLTRHALADAMGVELDLDEASVRHIERFFERMGRTMPARNRVQAMIPRTAHALANPHGTAPGIHTVLAAAAIYILPGVPHEMRAMFDRHVLSALAQRRTADPRSAPAPRASGESGAGTEPGRVILTASLHTFGAGESDIAQRLGDLTDRARNPLVGTTVSDFIVSVRIRSEAPDRETARRQLDRTADQIERRLGPLIFGRDGQTLQRVLGELLRHHRRTLATAESCTAGLLGRMLTDPPGASDYYLGGWIVYSNRAKQRDLAVPEPMLREHGAVSEPVALTLADRARQTAGADYALAITGIAGPSGGTADKPIGTVWIALAERERPTLSERFIFPGDREAVRQRAALAALNLLRLRLLSSPPPRG